MKFNLNNKYFRWGVTAFLVIVAGICFYYLLFHGATLKAGVDIGLEMIMPVLIGLITAYLMTPILNHIEYYILIPFFDFCKIKASKKRTSIIRGIGIILTSVLVFTVIYCLIYMLLSQIVPSIQNIISNFDNYIDNFTIWLTKLLEEDYPEIGDYIIKMINKYSDEFDVWLNETILPKTSSLIKTVSLSVISVLGILWDFILGFVIPFT